MEPLLSVQDEITTQTPVKMTRSSVQKSLVNTTTDNLVSNKAKSKEISNQMLEEISANFVLNSSMKNVATEYKNVMVGRSRVESANISGCIVPIGGSASKETIIVRKDGQSFPTPVNMLTTFDGKILKQKRIIDLKGTNIKCIDGKLSFTNPVVLLKKPFNIKLASELKNKTDDQLKNSDPKKTIRINNSSQNLVQLLDANQPLSNEDVTLEDNVNIDDKTVTNTKKLPSKESQNLPITTVSSNDNSNVSVVSKSISLQLNEKKTKNDKIMFNVFGKPQSLLNNPSKKSANQDSVSKIEVNSSISEPNNRYIKELDFDMSISQTSLSEFYNDVEEIVEMHSFDNEELNSLIECGSLDNSETEEPQNVIKVDHGDSSVSESDSTIGAFDTFAQITGVPPKSSSKDNKSLVNEPKVLNKGGKDLERDEGFVQSDEIDDEQSSSAVPMTGIPVLKSMLSTALNRIDSDTNSVDTKTAEPEIIELISSSDEENDSQHSTNVDKENDDEDDDDDDDMVSEIQMSKPRVINEKNNIKSKSSSEIEISRSNSTDHDVVANRLKVLMCTDFIEKKMIDSNFVGQKIIECEYPDSKTIIPIHFNSQISVTNAVVNRENDLKEVKNNETESKVHLVNETAINPREITSNFSYEKLQEELKTDLKEILVNEDTEKNKMEEDKIVQDAEIVEVKELKESEAEILKRAKEVEKKEFEVEIMQRAKKPLVKRAKTPEITKVKESEMKNEIEMEKAKEIELKKSNELEMKKAKEIEIQKAKEIEIQKFKEIEMKKAKEIEMQKAKEVEIREAVALRAKEIELQKAKEAEAQRIKNEEIQQIKEAEIKKAEEDKMFFKMKEREIIAAAEAAEVIRAKQFAILKAQEMKMLTAEQHRELQRHAENKKKLENEAESKRKKEEDKKKIEDETTKSEETEIKKTVEEAEIRNTKDESNETKNIEVKEKEDKKTAMKGAELKKVKEVEAKDALPKKAKETEMKMRILEVHVQLQREELDNQSKKAKSDQLTHEAKKANVEETGMKEAGTEIVKSKEPASRSNKSVEVEVKKVKEIKEVENKINTRTRGSKTEEKLKDSNLVSKNISIKFASAVKPLSSSSSSSLTSQPTKNVIDENKRNDDINKCDKDLSSSEVSGKSRTRSSSLFKKNTSIGTISTSIHKPNEKSEDVIIPKSTVGVKIKILTSSQHDVPSSSANLQRNVEISRRETLSKALSENNLGKQLTVPLVKISTNRKPYYADNFIQRSDIGSVKQPVASM